MRGLNKGTIKGLGDLGKMRFIAWDAIDLCDREGCICGIMCDHDPTVPMRTGRYGVVQERCIVQYDALKEMERALIDTLPGGINQMDLYRIGTELVPLYKQWAKLNMYEIGTKVLLKGGKEGGLRPHPILKEIRAVIREIGNTWKSLDLRRGSGMRIRKPGDPIMEEMFEKDGVNYYELMEAGEVEGLEKKSGDRLLKRIGEGNEEATGS